MPAELSRDIQNDPSQSLHIEDRFEARLHALFRNFQRRIPAILRGRAHKQGPEDLSGLSLEAFQFALASALMEEILDPGEPIVRETIKEAYRHGIQFAVLWGRRAGVNIPLQELPADRRSMEILESRNLTDLKGITDAMSKEITRQMSDGILAARTMTEVARDMAETVDDIGLTRASTLVRTETMRAVNESTRERYSSVGIELFDRLEALDERTCTDWEFNIGGRIFLGCGAIDGQTFTAEEAAEVDAQTHPNCRGVWTVNRESLLQEDEQLQKSSSKTRLVSKTRIFFSEEEPAGTHSGDLWVTE
jgi:hypothetical protein